MRVTVNGPRAEISLKRKIDPRQWDQLFQPGARKNDELKEIKILIDIATLKINRIYSSLLENGDGFSAEQIKRIFNGPYAKRKTLLDVFMIHNEMVRARIGIDYSQSTYTRYQTTCDHIIKFMKQTYKINDIVLQDIKYSFVTDFEHFLKIVHRCNHNSTQKYIRNFRKIINNAIKNDWLDKDPFKAYRVKLKETKRVFLTKDELELLEKKVIPIDRLGAVRDVFVFCCYTGLSYVDVEKLSATNIFKASDGESWINIDRTKTGNPSNVLLLPTALKLLNRYKENQGKMVRGKLLPVISNQRINAYLKEIANIVGIEKNLTFHAARHTFATTVTLNNGIPIETVSALLGHKNLRRRRFMRKLSMRRSTMT